MNSGIEVFQKTVLRDISIEGVALHSGAMVAMEIKPGAPGSGITFIRSDVQGKNNCIPAKWDHVVDTKLCTVIGNADGVRVATIEHLMAALRGCGVDNAEINLNGPEVPVMDGSSMPFVKAIEQAGLEVQSAPRRFIRVLRDVTVTQDGKTVSLSPDAESVFHGRIEFNHPQIGRQVYETKLMNGNFKHEIAEARTFGFLKEVEMMRAHGLALGGSLENAIVVNDQGVMNPEGLRFVDEFVRHKILDAVGDLYLAGAPILGAYRGDKGGHALNNALLQELFSDERNYEIAVPAPVTPAIAGKPADIVLCA
jgi:UDP-3-O-[3-hydroxymyristoyl] N-acetylglucosamine deacetylase